MISTVTEEEVWSVLETIIDPELPVVTLVEMGIIREVEIVEDKIIVTMTPTFSGCPALQMMKNTIVQEVKKLGVAEVDVKVVLSPPWSTDWIQEEARTKLQDYGIAPPHRHCGKIMMALSKPSICPYCGSQNTEVRNDFGPTPCKALCFCNECREPFEQFKPL